MRLQPLLHAVRASAACGYSLDYIWLQARLHTVTASAACGYSLDYIRLQPLLHTVAASAAYGCSLDDLRATASAKINRVAASACHTRLQVGCLLQMLADAPISRDLPADTCTRRAVTHPYTYLHT